MSVMTSVIPHGRPFTVDDLEGMPDDGNRYELIDGMLHVSPCPLPRHQIVLGEIFVRLHGACPPDLRRRSKPPRCCRACCGGCCWRGSCFAFG